MWNPSSIYFVAAFFFFTSLSYTLAEIYRDALFLSSYPNHWLAYLFLGVAALNIAVFTALGPIIRKKQVNRYIVAALIVIGCILTALLPLQLFWLPFIVALYLSLIQPSMLLICYSLASSLFSIREFKKYAPKMRALATVAIILASFATPSLVAFAGADSLLYIFLGCLICLQLILFLVNPVTTAGKEKTIPKIILWDYPLLRVLFPIVIFMSLGYFSVDYLLKSKLAIQFSRDSIASFLGIFLCVMNVILLVVQLFATQLISNRLGVIFLFYISPTVVLLGAFVAFLFPSLTVITVYTMCVFLSYNSFYTLGFEMAIFPLPHQVRLSAKAIETVLDCLGQGVTAIFFIAMAYLVDDRYLLLIVLLVSICYCVPWYYMIVRAQTFYRLALEKSLRLCGFAADSFLLAAVPQATKEQVALDILKQPSQRLYSLAFSLIGGIKEPSPLAMEAALEKIDGYDPYIQLQALDALEENSDGSIVSALISQLKKEEDDVVVWKLVTLIIKLKGKEALDAVEEVFQQPMSPKQVYMVPIALSFGSLDSVVTALHVLHTAIKQSDDCIRLAASRALSYLMIGDPESHISRMIEEPVKEIVSEGINCAATHHLKSLIPVIARHLADSQLLHVASKALLSFDASDVVPELHRIIEENTENFKLVVPAIKTLSQFRGRDAERALIALANHANAVIATNVAHYCLISDRKMQRSSEYKHEVYKLIFQETARRGDFKNVLSIVMPSYIHKELKLKLHMSSLRCLYWYGCYVAPEAVFKVNHYFKDMELDSEERAHKVHAVLEFLDSLAPDARLHMVISQWENQPVAALHKKGLQALKGLDGYLDKLIDFSQHKGVDVDQTINKLIVLREVRLFENLAADILYAVAEEAEWREMSHGEVLFVEGDMPDGVYIIASGEVLITTKGKKLSKLKEFDFFGEIGVINNSVHLTTAVAVRDSLLLYINDSAFDELIHEFPEILLTITKTLINYLHDEIEL